MAGVEVWWAGPDTTPASLDLLDEIERGRHDRYVRAEDRARFLTARVLAKTVAARRLGVSTGEIRLDATCRCGQPHGKPRVVGGDVELSISHSGDWVVVAMSAGVEVGVDVEKMPTRPLNDGMLDAVLSAPERALVRSLPPALRPAAFLSYWTRKEALLKATGEGLTTPMSGITLTGPDEPPRLLDPGKSIVDPDVLGMAELRAYDGYRACLAVLDNGELVVSEHDAATIMPGREQTGD